jgi:hypothetical protein
MARYELRFKTSVAKDRWIPWANVLPLPTFAPTALDQSAQHRIEFARSSKVGAGGTAQSRGKVAIGY